MRQLMTGLLVVTLMILISVKLWAHGDDATPNQVLTGEVVCVSCYLAHDGIGEDHAKCAKKCFQKGMPMGLKVGNKLYLVVGEGHASANAMLSAYAGEKVTVSGHLLEKDGMSMIEIESIQKLSSSKDPTVHQVYVCPMDGTMSDNPGKCPKCGMEMKEKK